MCTASQTSDRLVLSVEDKPERAVNTRIEAAALTMKGLCKEEALPRITEECVKTIRLH